LYTCEANRVENDKYDGDGYFTHLVIIVIAR